MSSWFPDVDFSECNSDVIHFMYCWYVTMTRDAQPYIEYAVTIYLHFTEKTDLVHKIACDCIFCFYEFEKHQLQNTSFTHCVSE